MADADLSLVPREAVLSLAAALGEGRRIEQLTVPQQGLWLLQLEEPVRRDGFYLGEVPVGQACVALHDPARGEARGGAILLHADRELAVAAAVCDAVSRAGWPGADEVARLRAAGAATRAEAERARAGILASTRVDFSELTQEDA
jgi:alpha-D-ribose 1-methylphosphonate 5-triphosphate synthase subunit PhnG